jgi:hypothetical protein
MRRWYKTRMRSICLAAALGLLVLAACGEQKAAVPPPAAPAASPAPATDRWIGQWTGPEGGFLRIEGSGGRYELTIQNLDGPRKFAGTAAGDTIVFERDGTKESVHASDGNATGMKWLAGKSNCLTVRTGEGYCRD